MKYTAAHPPMQCFMTQSRWHKCTGKTTVKGVLWHSTGANNPNLKRYVQPDENAPNRAELLALLGVNKNGNDWNREGTWVDGEWVKQVAGVHAWIGKLVNGEVTSVQVDDWDRHCWGCGPGSKGSCNDGWIQFEICEDGLNDPVYFNKVYQEAVELTAYLCKLYNLDPLGTVTYCGVKAPVILCHQDSYRIGLGGDHSDVYHWFDRYGKTMDDVRADVARVMENKEEKDLTEKEVRAVVRDELAKAQAEQAKAAADKWALPQIEACIQAGIMSNVAPEGEAPMIDRPKDPLSRQEAAVMAARMLTKNA